MSTEALATSVTLGDTSPSRGRAIVAERRDLRETEEVWYSLFDMQICDTVLNDAF